MTKSTIAAELFSALKVKVVAGEDSAELAERLARKGADVSDAVWETLSQEAQVWVNSAVEAIEGGKALPSLEGLEAFLEGDDDGGEEEEVVAKSNGKVKKAPKEAKAKKAATGSGRGRKGKFAASGKIKLLVKENPHREGTYRYELFKKYRDGMTVEDAVEAGVTKADLRFAVKEGRLTIS